VLLEVHVLDGSVPSVHSVPNEISSFIHRGAWRRDDLAEKVDAILDSLDVLFGHPAGDMTHLRRHKLSRYVSTRLEREMRHRVRDGSPL
jgi:hypothetical protein